jgi:RNA polymerase sporulation-specific sigma factor
MGSVGQAVSPVFDRMRDERVVACAKNGCSSATEHLLKKYKHLVEGKARSYFLVGAEHDDVVQEGMIGLYKAIRDYSHQRHLSAFRSFADLCITRQIITAIKTATRQKHWLLNTYISIEAPVEEDAEERTLRDLLAHRRTSQPDSLVLGAQFRGEVRARILSELSELEANALLRHIEGDSYQEIARRLTKNVKQIDNALQRAKRKIGRVIGGAICAESRHRSGRADVAQWQSS